MKKLMALLLSVLLCAGVFVLSACSESGINEESESAVENESATPDAGEETEESDPTVSDYVRETYSGNSYEGYEYKVLSPGPGKHYYNHMGPEVNEVYAEEMDGTPLNDAIYTRNRSTEELLDISVSPIFSDNVTGQTKNEITAGTAEFDTVINDMSRIGEQAEQGYFLNLMNIDSIDVTNTWWDKNIVGTFTLFNSKLYWITGDINVFDDYAVEVLFMNKRILEDNGFEAPYSDVLEGTWTIDRMYQICKAVERDVDGDGKIVVGTDVVGHCEVNDHIKHWIYAMGEKSLDVDSEGNLVLHLLDERQIQAIDTLFSYMVEKQMTYSADISTFPQGTTAFHGEMLGSINMFRDMEDEFGVVPMAKMNEEQESYGNYVSNGWSTAYAIPNTNKDPERTGTILEVLCGFSTDTVRSALYDVLFAAKLVRDTESVEMLNIIFATKSYDWSIDFSWGGNIGSAYNKVYSSKSNSYVSTVEKVTKSINKQLNKMITDFTELDY